VRRNAEWAPEPEDSHVDSRAPGPRTSPLRAEKDDAEWRAPRRIERRSEAASRERRTNSLLSAFSRTARCDRRTTGPKAQPIVRVIVLTPVANTGLGLRGTPRRSGSPSRRRPGPMPMPSRGAAIVDLPGLAVARCAASEEAVAANEQQTSGGGSDGAERRSAAGRARRAVRSRISAARSGGTMKSSRAGP